MISQGIRTFGINTRWLEGTDGGAKDAAEAKGCDITWRGEKGEKDAPGRELFRWSFASWRALQVALASMRACPFSLAYISVRGSQWGA